MNGATRLFLSASFPSGERGKPYEPYHPPAILDAVVTITRVILRRGATLTFGAHPSISPLVLSIAKEVRRPGAVEIFQSERYHDVVPSETLKLEEQGWGAIVWVNGSKRESRQRSLARMRRQMLDREIRAGVFVGGMRGIPDEFAAFRKRHPDAAAFVLRGPGGGARHIRANCGPVTLVEGDRYPDIALAIADAVGLPPAGQRDPRGP